MSSTVSTNRTPKRAPTAMVCDDDATSVRIARSALEHAGYNMVAGVETAIDAIQVALLAQPDVIVLDLGLPFLNGDAAIPALRAAAPECTIVVYSGANPDGARRNGASYIVPKGATRELECVLHALALRRRAG